MDLDYFRSRRADSLAKAETADLPEVRAVYEFMAEAYNRIIERAETPAGDANSEA